MWYLPDLPEWGVGQDKGPCQSQCWSGVVVTYRMMEEGVFAMRVRWQGEREVSSFRNMITNENRG